MAVKISNMSKFHSFSSDDVGFTINGAYNRLKSFQAKSLATLTPTRMIGKLKNPFFFVGCGRSGTSLLIELLASHPEIAGYPYEANELWHPYSYPWTRYPLKTAPIWYDPYGFTAESLASRRPKDDQHIKAVFGAFQLIHGGKCFLNKSVLVTFMIPYILNTFPNARLIHIVRDGRAVALSWTIKERKKMDRAPYAYRQWGIDYSFEELLDKFAEHWMQHIAEIEIQKRLLNLEQRGILLELTYEELCAHPHRELARLARFMEIDPDIFAAQSYDYVRSTDYKFRKQLSAATIERISGIMQPTLELKNYLLPAEWLSQ